jgi:hypothetical protein
MPNWTTNTLTIVNLTLEQETELIKQLKSEEFLSHYLPTPDFPSIPNEDGELPVVVESKDKNGEVWCIHHQFESTGEQDTRWYDWQVKNWGTKWDIADVNFLDTDCGIWVSFQTAWAPCVEGLQAISKQFPLASFILGYHELGCDFAGAIAFTNGEVIDGRQFAPSDVMDQWLKNEYPEVTDEVEKQELWFHNCDELIEELVDEIALEFTNKIEILEEEEDWDEALSRLIDYAEENGLNPDHVIGAHLGA